jgi:lipoprotein-anchoring transpeptidase ErfK/SrfK
MVFATLTSTGKGTSGPESFTPVGKWRINNKLRSSRMAGGEGASYHFLSDVPWVQYYYRGYAIHGVYWHNGFGWPLSQGCTNLTPKDAQWVFNFTGPHLPEGWYSMLDLTKKKGTWVVVQK